MNREELDTLWFQAMRQSIGKNGDFIRYHFAALVAAAEREACAKVCDGWAGYGIPSSAAAAAAIRSRGEVQP